MNSREHFKLCLAFLNRMRHHLEYKDGENPYRIRSYQVAAEALEQHGTMDGIESVRGIGKSMLAHFDEIKKTGTSALLDELSQFGPPFEVRELTSLPGIGPKGAVKLFESSGVTSMDDLATKIKRGEFTDAKIIHAYYDWKANSARIPRAVIQAEIGPVLDACNSTKNVTASLLAGSFRRWRPDCRDIDILLRIKSYSDVASAIRSIAKATGAPIEADGDRKAYLRYRIGGSERKLDLNFIESDSWGTAVFHFTGSAKFNVAVRTHAEQEYNCKVSQYCIDQGRSRYYFDEEEHVFEFLHLPYTPPECRDRHLDVTKEISVVSEADIVGDLHSHTDDSDGALSVDKLLGVARKQGYTFFGISNHSKSTGNGLKQEEAVKLAKSIRAKRKKMIADGDEFRPYASVELDVRVDGTLDYDVECLKAFDYVVLSTHVRPDFDVHNRMQKALKKIGRVPVIIAHPTGRLIGHRSGADVDWVAFFKMCKLHNVVLEINGQGDRCDLPDDLIVNAKRLGCLFAVNSDCHGKDPWSTQINAVHMAMRGLLTKRDIVNTSRKRFRAWLDSFKD